MTIIIIVYIILILIFMFFLEFVDFILFLVGLTRTSAEYPMIKKVTLIQNYFFELPLIC
jgi:hypothetical protein